MDIDKSALLEATSGIIQSYVANNTVLKDDLPGLISNVYSTLANAGSGKVEVAKEELVPAASVKKSITPDYIICLEDGKKFKSLKRHLRSAYNLSPDEYRAKWGLAADYPMVAPNYAAQRSSLAKTMGLGTMRRRGA